MPSLALLLDLIGALARTLWRRLVHGPARPTWSFGLETMVSTMKATARRVSKLDWTGQRAAWDANATPSPVFKRVTIEPISAGGVDAAWFVPAQGASQAVVLYLHGGAYLYGSRRSHGELIARVALASGARVLALDYHLAPEHPFPAAIEDVVAGYRWLLGTGVAASQVVIAGDSAGGGLAVAAMVSLRDGGEALPAGAMLLCPWVDLSAREGSFISQAPYDWSPTENLDAVVEAYLAGTDPKAPLASPVHANLIGLPPMLIQVGTAEKLLDQVVLFAERAKSAGIDTKLATYEDMVHVWHVLAAQCDTSRRAIEELGQFVRQRCVAGDRS